MSNNYIPGISLIRCILCFMICSFHWMGWSSSAGGCGVDWFIILSGYLMFYHLKENQFNTISFYCNKFSRLWPLLFLAYLTSALIDFNSNFNVINFFSSLIASIGGNQFVYQYTGITNYALWYMKLEIIFVAIFPLIAFLRNKITYLLLISLIIAFMCVPFLADKQLYTFPLYRIAQFMIGVYGAYCLKKYNIACRVPQRLCLITFFIGVLYMFYQIFIGALFGGESSSSPQFVFFDSIIAIIVLISAQSLACEGLERNVLGLPISFINWFSKMTYAVFLFHVPVRALTSIIYPNCKDATFWSICVVSLIAFSIILHYVIEIPAAGILRKFFKKLNLI